MAPAPPPPETEPSRDDEATPTPAPADVNENVVPGPRATRLRALYGQALQHTLGKLAWENFAACYPTISSRSQGVLRQVQGQMVGKLGEKCQVNLTHLLHPKEFDNIIVSRQVVPKLNELESLIADASKRRAESDDSVPDPTPPHLLPPDRILSAHLTPALIAHQSQLNARLQTTQSQNALLHEEILRQQGEVEELMAQLDALVADVKGANGALAEVADMLAAESREAEAAISGTKNAAAAAES
ncbi:unnamed protein product [Clonostachys chloroleuca]|uniref:Kinetochore-associated protein NNF1 n=1 Tax=Clonostachys chloroleuca TaxID=1926264 RepID=A0AA35M7Q0_9HYPO|nr:unnamed protein product [Clonostachys chloroleuca]